MTGEAAEAAQPAQPAGTAETETCPTCSTDLMSVADADLGDAMLVAIVLGNLQKCGTDQDIQDLLARDPAGQCEPDDQGMVVTLAWCLHSAGADDQVSALLSRLSAAGEWSLLDEIHERTGLEVTQKQ